jgi:penicillin-binding protein 2
LSARIEDLAASSKNMYRFAAFVLTAVIAVTALGSRMFYLQVVQSQTANQLAAGQSSTTEGIPSTRGLIFDAAHNQLVKNVVSYSVTIVPNDLPIPDKARVIDDLASILQLDPATISMTVDSATGSLFAPVTVADDVPVEVARFIEENAAELPGVAVVTQSKREYLNGPLFGQIVGYTGPITANEYNSMKSQGYSALDDVGQAGLEASYEQQLRGTYGQETLALDAQGRPIPGLVTQTTQPIPGESLTLSIDTKEQQLAQKALAWGLHGAHVTKGVIIVENPQNGQILAMVSLPTYDDQLFTTGLSSSDFTKLMTSPDRPLVNKAISEQYAPGSTFKLVTGTAGLAENVITPTTKIVSKPFVQIDTYLYWEWNHQGWGPLNITTGLAHSSDTFFYQLAAKVGLTNLTKWASLYGFGAPTGIDLPNEASGIVPTNAWKLANKGAKMFPGEVLQAGIGQGYDAATPMQLLNAYSALANGGNLWEPRVVASITDANGVVHPVQPTLIRKLPASQSTLETMRLATRAVVTSQHTYNMVDLPIKVAGKTGTAEFGLQDRWGQLPYHEWFVGYTPGDPYHGDFTKPDSKLAVVAFVYGADTWGNVATEIVKYYMMLHYGIARPFQTTTPGYVLSWVLRTTNFYGQSNRD